MASSKTISIGFKIEEAGKNGFQQLVMDANALNKAMRQAVTTSAELNNKMINFGSLSIGLDALSSAFQQVQGYTKEFTSAYRCSSHGKIP